MAKSRSYTRFIVFILLLGGVAGAWYYFHKVEDAKPVYTTTTVGRGTLAQVVTATGSLQPVTSVEVGSQVKAGETVCIIEAMKILNEIEADQTGTITQILCVNGQAVEYGQSLFVIE